MKRIIILLLLAAQLAVCQNIPNNGFENWQTVGGWYENPLGWQTNNSQLIVPVVKGNPRTGNFSMQVNSGGLAKIGFALNQRPFHFQCYAKSNLLASDSAHIKVFLYSAGIRVDSGQWNATISLPNWTVKNIAITNSSSSVDSMEIIVKGGLQQGSTLNIDDISFSVNAVAEQTFEPAYQIYPNPATNRITIDLPDVNQIYTVQILDMNGRLMSEVSSGLARITLPVSGYPTGQYYCCVKAGNRLLKSKLVFVCK